MSNTEFIIKVIRTGMFPIKDISSGRSQARTHHVTDNIDVIKNNLKKFGQLTPITIFEENGKYELITGQRRLNAAEALGWTEIRAEVIEKPKDELMSKAISFLENEIREKMSQTDVINACNEFYYKYGTIKAVSEELALPYELVNNAVKLPRCPTEVKEAVKEGKITLKTAVKASKALQWDSSKPKEGSKVLELAKKMDSNMPIATQKAVMDIGKKDPTKSVNEIISEAESSKESSITIILGTEEHERLGKYASDEDEAKPEAAANLILNGLSEHGY